VTHRLGVDVKVLSSIADYAEAIITGAAEMRD